MPRPFKVYTELDRQPLPDPGPLEEPALSALDSTGSDTAATTIDSTDLATLCHYATGITKTLDRGGRSMRFRAAACTGKLYHIDLYPVVGPGGPVEPGVYHYDPIDHVLDRLRSGDHRAVLADAIDRGGETPVTILAASEWWRNAWKYRERTYRHAFWDSGTIIANLLAAAQALDLEATVHAGFVDDPIVGLLALDPDEEAPVAAVTLGADGPDPPTVALDAVTPATEPVSEETVEYPIVPDAWRQSRFGEMSALTNWRDRVETARREDAQPRADPAAPVTQLEPVDAETASSRPLDRTIERRGSLREYSHDPISRRMVATVLDRAFGRLPIDGRRSSTDRPIVDPYCLCLGVEDVPTGSYRYDPIESRLDRVADIDRSTAGHLALDQPVVGDAAVNVYLTVDVDRLVDRLGNRGYRLAQLEAGLLLGRLYLATYAHRRIGGRGFTFYDRPVADHLGGDRWPMTMFAFGRRPSA